MTDQQITDLIAQIIRVGYVNARQPEKMRVKVTVPDTVGKQLVTDYLPVLCPRASGDMQYDLPDVGDQVLCLFLPYGLEQGFVVGAMYGRQEPPVQSGEKWHRTFRDGTRLEYDREQHKLVANVQGDVEITATGNIRAELEGELSASAQGPASVKSASQINMDAPAMNMGGPSGTAAAMQGDFNLTKGDVKAEGVSLRNHVHTCPACGAATSPPVGGGGGGGNAGGAGGGNSESGGDRDSGNDSGGEGETGSGNGDDENRPTSGSGDLKLPQDLASALAATGFELTPEAKAQLEETKKKVHLQDNGVFDTILCLPAIAEAEARKASGPDRLGLLYLKQMFEKWLSGAANMDAPSYANPLWISWDWAMTYTRAKATYLELISKDLQEGTIYSLRAMQKLGEILCGNGYLDPARKNVEFDFTDSDPALWEKLYFTLKEVGYDGNVVFTPQGLYAAMGNFSLRALAAGSAENLGDGCWRITLKKASVFIHDQFNFAGPEFLGFWSCEHLGGARALPGEGYIGLANSDFRSFREKFGRGSDFLVLSKPHLVEDMKEASYVTTCSE